MLLRTHRSRLVLAALLLPLTALNPIGRSARSWLSPPHYHYITITQYPASPHNQSTGSITVTWGWLGGTAPPDWYFVNPSFVFMVNGVDRTSYFTINGTQATATNVPLVDDAVNTFDTQINASNGALTLTEYDTKQTTVDFTPPPTVTTTANNFENQSMGRCVASCFTAVYAQGTVPYITLDAPHNLTLVYHGDRMSPRPFVYADVQHPLGSYNVPQEYWLRAKVNGVFRQFTNNEDTLHFVGSPQLVRLGGQLDMSTYATGIYTLDLVVTSKYATKNEETVATTKLTVVNENASPIGRGWSVAGAMRLHTQGDGSMLLTEGDGSAVYFLKSGSNFITPTGDFRVLAASAPGWVLKYPDSTKIFFNSAGRDTLMSDRFNNQIRFIYDGSNRLWKIRDESGSRDIVLAYGTYGLGSVTDPMGRQTVITVASDTTLRVIKDPDGDSTRFTYDGSRRLSTVIDRRGGTSQFFYRSPSWKLDSLLLPSIPINGGGNQAPKFALSPWQTVGVPTATTRTSPFSPITPSSVQASATDPEGHSSTFTADRWGQPLIITDALSRTTTITRNAAGLPTGIAYPSGGTETYVFDGSGRVTERSATGQAATNFRYGAMGQPDSVWGTGQAALRLFLHASTGRVDSVRVGGLDSLKYRFWYNSSGQLTKTKDPRSDSTLYHYESSLGNLDSVLAMGGRFSRRRFDGYGRDTAVSANGTPWRRMSYDPMNRPLQYFDGVNANPTIFTYDQLFLTRVKDPRNQVYLFTNNALGMVTHRYDPADTVSRYDSYRYDRDGLLTGWTNRRNQAQSFTTDVLHRVTSKTGVNTVSDSFAYSTDGRRVVASNSVVRDSVFLNAGLLRDSSVTRIAGQRFRISYHKNAVAAVDSIIITNSAGITFVKRRFYRTASTTNIDSLGLDNLRIRLGRNSDGIRTKIVLPTTPSDTVGTTHTNLHLRWIDSLSHNGLNVSLGKIYGYDSLNRVAHRVNAQTSAWSPYGQDFHYDGLGRLTQVDHGAYAVICCGGGNDGWTASNSAWPFTPDSSKVYSYDEVGNRTDQSGVHAIGNRIQRFAGDTFEHSDSAGNVTRKYGHGLDTRYYWSAEGKLTSVVVGGTTVVYRYDALGRLVRRVKNATDSSTFIWLGGQLLAELSGTATNRISEYAYFPGTDRPLALITGATTPTLTRYYVQDGLGNIIGVIKDTTVSQRLTYDAWGKQQLVEGTVADTNRLRWKGLLWDSDAGLYYVRARWLDPQAGRFVSEDPIGLVGGVNQYIFVGDDPVNGLDPSGLCGAVCIGATAGAATGAALSAWQYLWATALGGDREFNGLAFTGAVVGGGLIGAAGGVAGAGVVLGTVGLGPQYAIQATIWATGPFFLVGDAWVQGMIAVSPPRNPTGPSGSGSSRGGNYVPANRGYRTSSGPASSNAGPGFSSPFDFSGVNGCSYMLCQYGWTPRPRPPQREPPPPECRLRPGDPFDPLRWPAYCPLPGSN